VVNKVLKGLIHYFLFWNETQEVIWHAQQAIQAEILKLILSWNSPYVKFQVNIKTFYAKSLSFIDMFQVFKYQAKESQLRQNLDENILLEYSKQSSEANCLTNGKTF